MNRLKTFLALIILILIFSSNCKALAETELEGSLDRIISTDSLGKTAVVSVSVREAESGNVVYERNSSLLLHPASTLKAFTTPVMLKYLGAGARIKTGLYKHKDNFYLKLSGDPLLTRKKLSGLFKTLKTQGIDRVKGPLIIDDSAIDDIPWGTGWMWDDENNPYMPKFNAYNLDNNLVKVKVTPAKPGSAPRVSLEPYFPVRIINTAITSEKNALTVERQPWLDPQAIHVSGEVASGTIKTIPVGNPEKYFIYRLKQILKVNDIEFCGGIKKGILPLEAVLADEISHSVLDEISLVNQKSNNLAAETLFKLTGAKYSGVTGTTGDGLKAFKQYYKDLGADTSELFIVDGSGVSHNDLIQTGWMSLALSKLYNRPGFEIYRNTLASPGFKNTLNGRFKNLPGKIWFKTGTLAGVSGLAGYLKTNSGKTYCFAVLIQNFKGSPINAKRLENRIIKELAQ